MSKKDWKKFRDEQVEQESPDIEIEETMNHAKSSTESNVLEHPSYKELEEKLTLAEQKVHEHWEKVVRATAELENIRTRASRDVTNAHRYGTEKLIQALIPVMDSLEQALQIAENNNDNSMREGLELTMKLFLDVLEKHDVRQLNPLGQVFDPKEHEAMTMQESSEVPPNTVLAVFQKGYQLHDRIVRPARVIVAKEKK